MGGRLFFHTEFTEQAGEDAGRRVLDTFSEQTAELQAVKSGKGIYLIVNEAFARYINLPPEAILGREDSQIFPEDLARDNREMDRRLLHSKKEMSWEGHRTTAQGKRILQIRGIPLQGDGPLFPLLCYTALDISEIRISGNSLYRKMLTYQGDVIVIIGEDNSNLFKSPNIKAQFGWDPEEVIGKPTWENVHPEDRDRVISFIEDLKREPDSTGIIECRYLCKDGSYKWIEFKGRNMIHDPEIGGILGNYRDITERKRALESLRESETRFKALHNASFGGITIHDKGIILDCNKGLCDISGYSMEELVGMDGLLLIAEKSRDRVMSNILSGYEKPYEVTGLRKNGEEYPIRLEAKNIPYRGKTVRVVEFRDITETKKAEEEKAQLQEQLLQAQKMESIGRLAGGVAHDFNNMLGVIFGYSELALQLAEEKTPLHDYLTEIMDAAERSMGISNQLLAFARRQTVKPSILDLNGIIENMLKMLIRLLGEDIRLVWNPSPDLWPVHMDPSQINQILTNLCVNARDAIPDVGTITIATENLTISGADQMHPDIPSGDFVRLTIGDTGEGMTGEIMENLFEPFYTTKKLNKGTGLGLATVYGIIKQNRGHITVSSKPGEGSLFSIYLPARRNEIVRMPGGGEKEEVPLSRGETILLVEDEPGLLAMTANMLDQLQYRVLAADSPRKALDLLKENSPVHMLITDVIMPEMNGKVLSDLITSLNPEIKVLYISGYTADVIDQHGVLSEQVHFLQKPFSRQQLAVKIRRTLSEEF